MWPLILSLNQILEKSYVLDYMGIPLGGRTLSISVGASVKLSQVPVITTPVPIIGELFRYSKTLQYLGKVTVERKPLGMCYPTSGCRGRHSGTHGNRIVWQMFSTSLWIRKKRVWQEGAGDNTPLRTSPWWCTFSSKVLSTKSSKASWNIIISWRPSFQTYEPAGRHFKFKPQQERRRASNTRPTKGNKQTNKKHRTHRLRISD